MSNYQNGPGNVPRLPDRVVDTLIDSAGVSRCAPGATAITVRDQTAEVERLVHDACEELLARLPDAAPVAPLIPTEQEQVRVLLEVIRVVRNYPDFDADDSPFGIMLDEALAGKVPALLGAIDSLANGLMPTPPAVTAKPEQRQRSPFVLGVKPSDWDAQIAAAHRHAAIGAAVAMATKWDSMPDAKPSKSTLVQQVAQARAEVATWPDSVRESVGIPPLQAPDPIYLIRPKAGGTTWTECISEQSYDAAMRLGVYESRVVVEVSYTNAASCPTSMRHK